TPPGLPLSLWLLVLSWARSSHEMSARRQGFALEEDDPGVVGHARRARLVAVGHEADSLQLGDLGVGVAIREMRAEQLLGLDLFLEPFAGGRAAAVDDDRVGRHERIARPIASGADGCFGAPDELERVPAQSALPNHVEARRAVAAPVGAFVPADRE